MKKDKYIAGIDPVYNSDGSLESGRFVIGDMSQDPMKLHTYCKSCSNLIPLESIDEETSNCRVCINRAVAVMEVMDNLKLVE